MHAASHFPGYTTQYSTKLPCSNDHSQQPHLPWEGEPPAHPAPLGICFHRQMRGHWQRTLQTPAHEGHLYSYSLTDPVDPLQTYGCKERPALPYLRAGTTCSARYRHSWEYYWIGTAARHRKTSLQPELNAKPLAIAQQIQRMIHLGLIQLRQRAQNRYLCLQSAAEARLCDDELRRDFAPKLHTILSPRIPHRANHLLQSLKNTSTSSSRLHLTE